MLFIGITFLLNMLNNHSLTFNQSYRVSVIRVARFYSSCLCNCCTITLMYVWMLV